ncbi:MAG: dienelactone hydrolase family protein [Methylobacteriaceae bacterium]|nr:dienelactone hydrolase family protein [Methylobacteriaceae bacterium]MBV9634553.1 dienelactone hydrolase family protein [Methylobacteriaceae bacterium]MBV9704981.1 dienelactone hydrolase family protein [Methylobacteriaceae bacterium]
MGDTIKLIAKDGFELSAYRASPEGTPRAALVLCQEIFGVNHHIRSIADGCAEEGYLAIAPALFDRIERGVELGYGPQDRPKAMELVGKTQMDSALHDVGAAIEVAGKSGKVGVLGYCWGGTVAYAAACRLGGISAACGYYGGGIAKMRDERPKVPLILHFGEYDQHIKMTDVEAIKRARPEVPVYIYPADHGFNCEERSSYNEASAELARTRTLTFFAENLV